MYGLDNFSCESYFLQLYSSLAQSEIPTPWVGSGSYTFKCIIGTRPLHFSQRPWWPILVSYKITGCLYISKAQCFPKLFQNVYFIWYLHQCYEVNRVSNSISERRKLTLNVSPLKPHSQLVSWWGKLTSSVTLTSLHQIVGPKAASSKFPSA